VNKGQPVPKPTPTVSLMGSEPTEHPPEHRFWSERVKKMLETLPKYYPRRSEIMVVELSSAK